MVTHIVRIQELRIGPKYQLIRKLGAGAFGDVYLGIESHHWTVNVKRLTL
jgi:serine/threonine protein kinase